MNSMNFIKIQGIGFCALAFLFTLVVSVTNLFSGSTEVIFFAIMITTLGLPHGALDTLFAKNRFQLDNPIKWTLFVVIYLAIAAFILQVWIFLPILFLITFLIISVFHFSADPASGSHFLSRILYGGLIIFLPTLFHADEVFRLFSFLVPAGHARQLVDTMQFMAGPWVFALLVACYYELQNNWLTALEMFSVALLATIVSPLVAFTVFFCGMHSARHILRMSQLTDGALTAATLRMFFKASILPTLAVAFVGFVVCFVPRESSFDVRIIQIVFVGLAALTVPHMVLLDGWNFMENFDKFASKTASRRTS